MQAQDDDLSVFRKFIEESLDLAAIEPEESRDVPAGAPNFTRYNPALADRQTFERDIQAIWDKLHHEQPGQTYWGFRLSPLEIETRTVLQELIFRAVGQQFPPKPNGEEIRMIIGYTMTLSWLVLQGLADKYQPPNSDKNDRPQIDDIDF